MRPQGRGVRAQGREVRAEGRGVRAEGQGARSQRLGARTERWEMGARPPSQCSLVCSHRPSCGAEQRHGSEIGRAGSFHTGERLAHVAECVCVCA